MSGSFFLSALVPTLLAISALAFLLTSGLQLINIRTKRKAPLITGFLGFFLLAVSTISPIANFINDLTVAVITVISSLLITSSYILKRLQTSFTEVSTKHSSANTQNIKYPTAAKDIKAPSEPKPSTLPSLQPNYNKPDPEKQQPAQAKATPTQITRSAIKKETGLRAEPLVRLPAQRRKKARKLVNTLIGFLVFFLVGWGSYTIAKRVIKPQQSPEVAAPSINNKSATSPLPPGNIQLVPQEAPPEEANPAEKTTEDTAKDIEEPEPSPKNMLTVTDTETGFLNVREGASTATAIITKINPGDTYEFLKESETGNWYKIQIDDNTAGWISAKYADKNY